MAPRAADKRRGISRRDSLKLSGLALGGLALGTQGKGRGLCEVGRCYPTSYKTEGYTYARQLPPFDPLTPVEPDEMRISFMGSSIPPNPRAQKMMSIFVEVGSGDQAVFDCGSGVCANYSAMGIGWAQMNKIFISHLHGDHMSDLSYIYQSGPQSDRKMPLFVFGPGPTGFHWKDPDNTYPFGDPGDPRGDYDDGTKTFCEMLRAMLRWQSESFCFQSTGLETYSGLYHTPEQLQALWGLKDVPVPVTDPRAPYDTRYQQEHYKDPFSDGYAVVPVELQYDVIGGIAYDNQETGLKITHFPVIHTRRGSIGFKLEWRGLSMVYTSDTKPEENCIAQASGETPLDVFIHEMVVPPEVWAMKILGLSAPGPAPGIDEATWNAMVDWTKRVQDSSHTTQGAFGHILSRISPRPRLTVPTHFPVTDDTVACALESVQAKVPDIGRLGEQLSWSFDLMVLRVFKDRILQHRAAVNDYSLVTHSQTIPAQDQAVPKYWKYEGARKVADPTAQLDLTAAIPQTDPITHEENYRDDGY